LEAHLVKFDVTPRRSRARLQQQLLASPEISSTR
jgi:hypothetical protein